MIQTWALFVDAYRELSSRKLFWLSLGLSLLVVGVLGAVGVSEKGVMVLWWEFEHDIFNSRLISPGAYYKFVFAQFMVPLWLGWGATILALVSTGGIFPDFIASGSIELMLAKPISRARLFLTKFATGLLFTTLQVTLFAGACFVVIGVRGRAWEPAVFWTVPILVLFYSYLFAVCVLLGIVTRSAITSILVTLILWFFVFAVNFADGLVLAFKVNNQIQQEQISARVERQEKGAREAWVAARTAEDGTPPSRGPTAEEVEKVSFVLPQSREALAEAKKNEETIRLAERIVVGVKTVLPKTSETLDLLKRNLGELVPRTGLGAEEMPEGGGMGRRMSRAQRVEFNRRVEAEVQGRTTLWILGTSLGFEGVVLLIAGRLFVRRDF
jgi:ABC-type transport system involved in multi-copper enzyme maturation permease subunit